MTVQIVSIPQFDQYRLKIIMDGLSWNFEIPFKDVPEDIRLMIAIHELNDHSSLKSKNPRHNRGY